MLPMNVPTRTDRFRARSLPLAFALAAMTAAGPLAASGDARSGAQAKPAASRCGALKGLPREMCLQCEGQKRSDASLFFCKEKVRTTYCIRNTFRNDPDCQMEPQRNSP